MSVLEKGLTVLHRYTEQHGVGLQKAILRHNIVFNIVNRIFIKNCKMYIPFRWPIAFKLFSVLIFFCPSFRLYLVRKTKERT